MSCSPATRERVKIAAAELRACDGVVAATVLQPGEGTEPNWSISLICEGRLQPGALKRIAAHDLRVGPCTPQGDGYGALVAP